MNERSRGRRIACLVGLLLAAALLAHASPGEETSTAPVAAAEHPPSLLADLSAEVWSVLDEHREALAEADPPSVLETVFQASPPYEFSGGSLVVRTDARWFATLPPPGDGSALLELRRWPGDSVLTLYAIAILAGIAGTVVERLDYGLSLVLVPLLVWTVSFHDSKLPLMTCNRPSPASSTSFSKP